MARRASRSSIEAFSSNRRLMFSIIHGNSSQKNTTVVSASAKSASVSVSNLFQCAAAICGILTAVTCTPPISVKKRRALVATRFCVLRAFSTSENTNSANSTGEWTCSRSRKYAVVRNGGSASIFVIIDVLPIRRSAVRSTLCRASTRHSCFINPSRPTTLSGGIRPPGLAFIGRKDIRRT